MGKRMARAVLAKLRTWYPELIVAVILAVVMFAGQKDDPLFAIFEAIVVGIGWALGFRHRHLPVVDVIRRIDAKLDDALAEDEQPDAEVRHLRSV